MKKVLLGTSALVAAGLVSGGAMAQSASEPIKMRIGGYYTAAAGFMAQDQNAAGQADFQHRDHAFKQDTEVHFLGETKLDNGLIVGVHFEFEGQDQTADQIDETWMYFKGSWGELRFGDEDDAKRLKAYISPQINADASIGVNSPRLAFTNNPLGTQGTAFQIENDATKVIYFTPSIFGFSFGASYAPDGQAHACRAACGGNGTGQSGGVGGVVGENPRVNNGHTTASNSVSLAANYDAKFGDFTTGLSIGGTQGTQEDTGKKLEQYRAGGQVGFGPVKVGGSYEATNGIAGIGSAASAVETATTTPHMRVYDAGATYTIGPFTLGAGWSHGSYTGFLAPGIKSILDQYYVGANYVLGPGINLFGGVTHDDYDSGTTGSFAVPGGTASAAVNNAGRNEHDTALVIGTYISF